MPSWKKSRKGNANYLYLSKWVRMVSSSTECVIKGIFCSSFFIHRKSCVLKSAKEKVVSTLDPCGKQRILVSVWKDRKFWNTVFSTFNLQEKQKAKFIPLANDLRERSANKEIGLNSVTETVALKDKLCNRQRFLPLLFCFSGVLGFKKKK